MLTLRDAMAGAARALSRDWYRAWPPARRTLAVVGLAGFEPATSATQTRRASQAALQPVPG